MSTATLSKEFFELIKAIGESKSKQEEDRIIQDEVRNLKQLLGDLKSGSKRMKEILVRLIYVEMLGHDASWGYVVAVQQTATTDLPQKRAGYLACALMLSPDHEFRFMLVNQMQRDLGAANVLEVCGALVAVCKLVTTEMIPALLPKVTELLNHDQSLVRKKAIMAIHRCYQLDPGSISHLLDSVKGMLRDRDPSVMGAALCLLHDLAKADPATQVELADQYVSILKQITEHRLPRDFDYHRMPAPWIQIKLLQLLATLGANDKRTSESMYEVLGECMKRADTGTNIGYAVVYEAVKTVTSIWPDTSLLDAAANAISRFVQSESYNLKYLGVTGLASIVRDHPRYALQHQVAIVDCLEDPDETLKRKTLELLFRMTSPANAVAVVDKLLSFLEQAIDPYLKADLVTRICQLADRFAPTNLWFVETMIRLLSIAGDLVNLEAVQNLLRLLAEGAEPSDEDDDDPERENAQMRKRGCALLLDAIKKPHASEMLLKAAFWSLGEYGYLLSTSAQNGHKPAEADKLLEDDEILKVEEESIPDEDEQEPVPIEEVLSVVCEVVDRATVSEPTTKAYGVTAIFKITAQMGVLTAQAKQTLGKHTLSRHTELQQRCREFLSLTGDMQKLAGVFPVDASCEDFENTDLNFLDEFTDILKAAGATGYQEHLRIVSDYDIDTGVTTSSSISPVQPGAKQTKLRFDAYEPPKLYETTITPPNPTLNQDSPPFSVDDLSKMMATGASVGSGASANVKSNVKAVWGPKGYMGSLPSLGGPSSQQASPTPPSPAMAYPASPVAQAPNTTQPTSQPLPYQSPDYDFGGPVSGVNDSTMEDLRPPPPPPKKPELSEKEKAAQALFGGLGGSASKTQSKSAKSTASARSAPTPASQPQAKKAPVQDFFSMEADILGVGSAPVEVSHTNSAMTPSTIGSGGSNDLLDLFSVPAPNMSSNVPFGASPLASSPMGSAFPAFNGSSTPAAQVKLLQPNKMDTGHFGSLWPSHSAEVRVQSRMNGGFADFIKVLPEKLGVSLVEFIPATQEAIFAGDGGSSMGTVLLHTKDLGMGNVNFMVRSKHTATTERVARFCKETVF